MASAARDGGGLEVRERRLVPGHEEVAALLSLLEAVHRGVSRREEHREVVRLAEAATATFEVDHREPAIHERRLALELSDLER